MLPSVRFKFFYKFIPQIKKEDTILAKRPEQLSVSDFIYLTNLVNDEKI